MNSNERSEYPEPLKTGGMNYFFRCSMPKCPFRCRKYVVYGSHVDEIHHCPDCNLYCTDKHLHTCLRPGQQGGHADVGQRVDTSVFKESFRTHEGSILGYLYEIDGDETDIESVFASVDTPLLKLLTDLVRIYSSMVVNILVAVKMQKDIMNESGVVEQVTMTTYFSSNRYDVHSEGEITSDFLFPLVSEVIERKNTFVANGSGWYVKRIESIEVKSAELKLLQHSKANGYLKFPLKRKGYVNFRNNDKRCFQYCISAALNWNEEEKKNSERPCGRKRQLHNYKIWQDYFHKYDFSMVEKGDVNIYNDIPVFEEANNIAVNVFTNRKGKVVLIRSSKLKQEKVVNLFLVHEKNLGESLYHFVLIQDINKFLANGIRRKTFFCQQCFRYFKREKDQIVHSSICGKPDEEEIAEFPEEWQKLKFQRPEMTLVQPFLIFYDFEAFSSPVNDNKRGKATIINAEYLPASYSIVIVARTAKGLNVEAVEYYDQENVMDHFFKRMFYWGNKLLTRIRNTNNLVTPSKEVLKQHEEATRCFMCHREFDHPSMEVDDPSVSPESSEDKLDKLIQMEMLRGEKKRVIKNYHHNHITGSYEGALCSPCNLRVKYKHEITCIAHNSTNYDLHLIIQALNSPMFQTEDIDVIAKSGEKFVQMTITSKDMYLPPLYNQAIDSSEVLDSKEISRTRLRFIDSNQFLNASLDTLSSNLLKENSPCFSLLRDSFSQVVPGVELNDQNLNLLLAKLPFPYTYLTDSSVLQTGHPIPDRKFFNNDLKCTEITDHEWKLVKDVCSHLKITEFREYTRVYTILDTLLLSVVWEHFRNNCINVYQLDPSYVSTASSYGWNVFLYSTKAEIDYVRQKDMLDMITAGIRGGQCFATSKYVVANNERSPRGYDPSKPRTHLAYFDCVSLYAAAMLNPMPVSDYEWVNVEELSSIDWKSDKLGRDGKGYILKVDLEYSHELHETTSSLPVAPQKKTIRLEELSCRQKRSVNALGSLGKSFVSQPKLVSDCSDKKEYIVHYSTLRFYLQLGMKLTKIHCGMRFTEQAYFKSYIERNVELRKKAKSKSEKDLIKMLSNSCFGRSLMSNKNLVEVKFCKTRSRAIDLIASHRLRDFLALTPDLSMFMLKPKRIRYDKIIQAGFCILEHAKRIFYAGFYQNLRKTFNNRVENQYVDTDGTVVLIHDPDNTFLADIANHAEFYDFSKLPPDSDIFEKHGHHLRTLNEGVAGRWKIESINIQEGVFLKSKQYSLLYFNNSSDLKCKGIPQACLNNSCSHDTYKSVVLENKLVRVDVKYIRSIQHRLYNLTVDKIAFHNLDVSRIYPDENNFNFSLPFSHHKLNNCKCMDHN